MQRHKYKVILLFLSLICLICLCESCVTSLPSKSSSSDTQIDPRINEIYLLIKNGNINDALEKCITLSKNNPLLPGLAEVQQYILTELTTQWERRRRILSSLTPARMSVNVDKDYEIPPTFESIRQIYGETLPLYTERSKMEKALTKKVSVHLDSATLDAFILQVGASEGINIITDSNLPQGTLTIHADDVPLKEILDYIARNLGVSFYAGENMIWVTKSSTQSSTVPLETRFYRLRKGISGDEIGSDKINILQAIERFVPPAEGSERMFDKKAHVLIIRDTRENLAKIEEIINILDVCPPQILIEARFISISIDDLRELGIDWMLNSQWIVSRKRVLKDSSISESPETVIDSGANITFTSSPQQSKGLSLTYRGILTEPLFQAVLHAIESSGKAQTLSVPKVTTVNNRPAVMRIGEDFLYFDEYDVQSIPTDVTQSGNTVYSSVLVPVGSPKKEELGIRLSVTPSVGADMTSITLNLVPEISEFVKYETYNIVASNYRNNSATNELAIAKLPIFRRSTVETEVIVESGETVVMGGLATANKEKVIEKVPILSSLPLIGKLFQYESIRETKKNLLIFVTATLLSQRGENLIPVITHQPIKIEQLK